jgi:hypothetical protein
MQSTHSELLIEPKNEYDDGQDETVEDLTLDDEELLEDLDQAGPSHGGEGSSQGYAQWQVGQNQDEVFLAAQEAAGQHRDAQGYMKYNKLECENCDKSYCTLGSLRRHQKYECGVVPKFFCGNCKAKFKHNFLLRQHKLKCN